jgi:glutamyl-tRNA synthetase
LLYRAFGWDNTMPEFAHLPLILKPDGKGKLSKRDGDKLGFPVFPANWNNPDGEIYSGYREWGYFPEAFVNMLAFLGWNPGTEQEIFSMEELCDIFTLERVGKSGSRFDPEKTKWFNQQYIRNKSNLELADLLLPVLKEEGINTEVDQAAKICGLIKERATFVKDIAKESKLFFVAPESYDENAVKKHWKTETSQILLELSEILKNSTDFTPHFLEEKVKTHFEAKEIKLGMVMTPFRIAVVGTTSGPGMFEIAELLGKDEVLRRIENALAKIVIN